MRAKPFRNFLGSLAVTLPVLPLAAQAPAALPMVSDRPDETESSVTVPAGMVQLEFGWVLARDRSAGVLTMSHTLPDFLARIGVADRVEARLGFDGWHRVRTGEGATAEARSGWSHLSVGGKVRFAEGRGARPSVAFVADVALPTGDDGFGAERVDPTFRLALAQELSEGIELGYNLGVQWESEAGPSGVTQTAAGLYTATVGLGLTERLGGFAEVFGTVTFDGPTVWRHAADAGFTYQVTHNWQLDLSAGVGLSEAAEDWFVGAGVVLRLPR